MKLNIKLYGLLLIVVTLITSSCTDMLDVERHGATNVDDFYKNDDEAMQALAAVYGFMTTTNWHAFEYLATNVVSDDTYTGGGSRGSIYEEINEYRHTPDTKQVADLYKAYYNTIYRCNLVINKINGDASHVCKRCVAEAKVLRAFVYLRLASYFGSCPIIVDILDAGSYQKPNNTQAEIFVQIEKDLMEAISAGVLFEKSSVNDQQAHVTKQTAQALLGKSYVYESSYLGTNRWSDARTVLSEVINSKKYELFKGDYINIWHKKGRFSAESMFETNCYPDQQNMISTWGYAYFGWRMERFNQSQLSAANNTGANISKEKVWGFLNPTKSLYDAFVAEESESGYRLNQTITTYKQLTEYPLTILKGNSVYGNEGYFENKMVPTLDDEITPELWAKNQVFLRYAEVLLLAAEAELPEYGGSQEKVDKYMNEIRLRAKVLNLPGGYTLADIQREKRLECCFEGTRFPDLVRWGLAEHYLKDQGKKIPSLYGLADGTDNNSELNENVSGYNVSYYETTSKGFQKNKHEFFPIPQGELNVNPYAEQHTGW